MPVIDPHQDWFLDSAKEEGGFTIMEFHRVLHTGDSRDLDIPVSSLQFSLAYSTLVSQASPIFVLRFAFSIIHGHGRARKAVFTALPLSCIILNANQRTKTGKPGNEARLTVCLKY